MSYQFYAAFSIMKFQSVLRFENLASLNLAHVHAWNCGHCIERMVCLVFLLILNPNNLFALFLNLCIQTWQPWPFQSVSHTSLFYLPCSDEHSIWFWPLCAFVLQYLYSVYIELLFAAVSLLFTLSYLMNILLPCAAHRRVHVSVLLLAQTYTSSPCGEPGSIT